MDRDRGRIMFKDFFIEIYSEEIPARMQRPAEQGYFEIFKKFFEENSIVYENLEVTSSPCRIAIYAKLQDYIEEKRIEIKGPKTSSPDQAIDGFCKSNNISKSDLVIKSQNGGEFYFLDKTMPRTEVKNILVKNIDKILKSYTWPKVMAWNNHSLYWVRPLKNIACFIGDELVNFQFEHLNSNNMTYGHKFMSHEAFAIKNYDDYINSLSEKNVIVSRKDRENIILEQIDAYCTNYNLKLNDDAKLLEEVVGLAEYPVVLCGKIDDKFINLPKEVLITSMRVHQKYFTASEKDGKISPYFFFVTNLKLDDYSAIISGNERVLRARLSDALYFYNQDLKIPLENNLEKDLLYALLLYSIVELVFVN